VTAPTTAAAYLKLATDAARRTIATHRYQGGVEGRTLFVLADGSCLVAFTAASSEAAVIMSAALTPENTASVLALARALVGSAITVEPIAAEPSTGRYDPRYVHRAGGWTLYLGESRYEFTAPLSEGRTRAVLLDALLATAEPVR
jgi:hypothetical protein